HACAAASGSGDASRPRAAGVALIRVPRRGSAPGSDGAPGRVPDLRGRAREGRRAGARPRARRDHPVRLARDQGRDRLGGIRRAGDRPAGGTRREAAGSTPQFGDRQSYQMQATNADEAMKEIRLDMDEGADIILVKPALPCLDLIRRAKQEVGSPLAAYQVSGEYAMIKAAAAAR